MTDFILSAFADEAAASLSGQLAALKRNGLTYIELRNIDGRSVIDFSDSELAGLAHVLKTHDVSVSAIASPIGKAGMDEDFPLHFARFRRAVRAAEILDTQRVRVFSFYPPRGMEPEACFDVVSDRMAQLCDYANAHGVRCCHENEKGICGDTDSRVLRLHQSLGDRMDAVFDPANFVQCGVHPGNAFPAIAPYVSYLHVKDALFSDGSVVPAGQGDGDLVRIIAQYRVPDAGKILTAEPHLFQFGGLTTLQSEKLLHKTVYESADAAFDAAVESIKKILTKEGYTYA